MLVKLSTAAILVAGIAFAAAPRLEAVERTAPHAEELGTLVARDGATAGARLLTHACTQRPSTLFGDRTYACRLELARGEERETVTRVVTAFDRGWSMMAQ